MKNNIINWTWEFPQTFLGFILSICYKIDKIENYNDVKMVYLKNKKFGISLGRYIFLYPKALNIDKKHEYGHCIQSKKLGIFYLILIGLPSITFNIISRFNMKFATNYYNRYPENWADKLGNVNRKNNR